MWIDIKKRSPTKEEIAAVNGVFRVKFCYKINLTGNALARFNSKDELCWYKVLVNRATMSRTEKKWITHWFKEEVDYEVD